MKITINLPNEIAMRLIKGERNIPVDNVEVEVLHDISGATREDIAEVVRAVCGSELGFTSQTTPQPEAGRQPRGVDTSA